MSDRINNSGVTGYSSWDEAVRTDRELNGGLGGTVLDAAEDVYKEASDPGTVLGQAVLYAEDAGEVAKGFVNFIPDRLCYIAGLTDQIGGAVRFGRLPEKWKFEFNNNNPAMRVVEVADGFVIGIVDLFSGHYLHKVTSGSENGFVSMINGFTAPMQMDSHGFFKELLTVSGIMAMPAMKEAAMKAAGVPAEAALPGVTPEYQVTAMGVVTDAVKAAKARLEEIEAERAAKGLAPLDAGFADLLGKAERAKAADITPQLLSDMIETARMISGSGWKLIKVVYERADLFTQEHVSILTEMARTSEAAVWVLGNLAKARADLAPQCISGLIEAAKTSDSAVVVLGDLAKSSANLAQQIISRLVDLAKTDTVGVDSLIRLVNVSSRLTSQIARRVICEATTNEGACEVVEYLTVVRPAVFRKSDIPVIVEAAKNFAAAARALKNLAKVRSQIFRSEHIPELIAVARASEAAGAALKSLAAAAINRLFRREQIPAMIDAAWAGENVFRALKVFAEQKPRWFTREHVMALSSGVDVCVYALFPLRALATSRPGLFTKRVVEMIVNAKTDFWAKGLTLFALAKNRPDLASLTR